MLIRSQDKKRIVILEQCTDMVITQPFKSVSQFNICTYASGTQANIGVYTTEAKAIKVLNMIQQIYSYSNDIQAFIDLGIPFEVMNNRVFQMPSDEEVAV